MKLFLQYRKYILVVSLVIVFFFLETALSFSVKKQDNLFTPEDELSFAMRIKNNDSDFPETEGIDLLVKNFLEKNHIMGASVAITSKEKLVYAKGFGIANDETGEMVQPGHLFRIASVSKLITAVAIMQLYEQGKISLTDTVFGPNGILNEPEFQNIYDPRTKLITLTNLLNHTAGWGKRQGDAIFNSRYIARKMKSENPSDLNMIIEYTLSQKLSYNPGQRYSYSNFGYALLGKIVEKITGMKYEDYVVMNILRPAGIYDMHIGRNLYNEKFPNEVKYFEPAGSAYCPAVDGSDKMVPKSYGGNDFNLLGAAGGWVASAPELAKLLTLIDGFDYQKDILKKETILMMSDPGVAGRGLFGWRGSDNRGTWWRTGTLSGTTALVMRQENGINWVILLNTSGYKRSRLHSKMSRTMFASVYRIKNWPDINLFETPSVSEKSNMTSIPALNPQL
ncbi:MAG: beta-lactamase family protein [Bacteroidales bacterium]|nr:beta-lactamase family protein [Bacteroidales bacterium]MCB9013859.1 beta-lactamase family protein [Bacteroidales bacterium]